MIKFQFFCLSYLGLVSEGLSLEKARGVKNEVLRYKVPTKKEVHLMCHYLDQEPYGVISTPLNFRTALCKQEKPLTQSETCLETFGTCYHDTVLNHRQPHLNEYTITFYFEYKCLDKLFMRVFHWRDVVADIDCTKSKERTLRISSFNSTFIYCLEQRKSHIHLVLQVRFQQTY